jgi:hypothetical protein
MATAPGVLKVEDRKMPKKERHLMICLLRNWMNVFPMPRLPKNIMLRYPI